MNCDSYVHRRVHYAIGDYGGGGGGRGGPKAADPGADLGWWTIEAEQHSVSAYPVCR